MRKLSLVIAAVALINGCASIKLDPQAQRIVVSPNKPPQGCKYLGQVVGNQGNFFTGNWTSNRNLEEGAMNSLKNEAGKMGANYVQLITNRAGVTGSVHGSDGYISGGSAQTNVTDLGNAYACPAKKIGLE